MWVKNHLVSSVKRQTWKSWFQPQESASLKHRAVILTPGAEGPVFRPWISPLRLRGRVEPSALRGHTGLMLFTDQAAQIQLGLRRVRKLTHKSEFSSCVIFMCHFSPDVSSPDYGKGCQKCAPFCQSLYSVRIPRPHFPINTTWRFTDGCQGSSWVIQLGTSCSIHLACNTGPLRGHTAVVLETKPNRYWEVGVWLTCPLSQGLCHREQHTPQTILCSGQIKGPCWDVFGDILSPGRNYPQRQEMDHVRSLWWNWKWLKWKD